MSFWTFLEKLIEKLRFFGRQGRGRLDGGPFGRQGGQTPEEERP